jgi:uncharacterized damage-inducible protein DinB
MTSHDVQLLLEYHYWARDRLLDAIEGLSPEQFTRDLGSSFKSVRDTVAHIYAAEWAWHQRWLGHSPTALLAPDRLPDVHAIRREWSDLESGMRAFIGALDNDGVARVIDYTLLSGAPGSSPVWQMLQHVVNHASYHRGQVATMLRQLGAPPAKPMDLIAFYRVTGLS